jgi:hypothetical protein
MRTFRQILREFWIPLVIAMGWGLYRVFSSNADWLSVFVANFAGAFFFTSWCASHFMRVRRQHATEDSFRQLERGLADVTGTIGTLVTMASDLLARTQGIPELRRAVESFSALTAKASTEVAAANNAFSAARASSPMHAALASTMEVVQPVYVPPDEKGR